MAKNDQRLIVTAFIEKDGHIGVKLDFFPKMPETLEAFNHLPEGRKGAVAVINQLTKQMQLAINGLAAMAEAQTPPPSLEEGKDVAQKA